MTRRRLRPTLAGPLAVVLAIALSACGGGGGSAANQSVGSLLSQTFGPHSAVHAGQLSVAVDLNLHGLQSLSGPLSFKLNGPFQGHGPTSLPDFDLSVLVGQSGTNFAAGLLVANDKAFVKFAGNSYALPDSALASFKSSYLQSQANAAKQKGGTFAAFGIDPRHWLTGATKAGTEQVGGAKTVHITAAVDVARFLADVNKLLGRAGQLGVNSVASAPTSISPAAIAALTAGVKSATVNIWTGASDRILRRLKIAVTVDVPPADRGAVRGLTSGTISLDLLLSDLNNAQHIVLPTNAQPLSKLTGSTASPLGGSGQSGAGQSQSQSQSGGSGQAGANLSAPPAYLSCVQRAGGDVASIQRCSSLLNAR